METDAQVSQLEDALIRQAETLAREQRQNAESARARILKEGADRLKLFAEIAKHSPPVLKLSAWSAARCRRPNSAWLPNWTVCAGRSPKTSFPACSWPFAIWSKMTCAILSCSKGGWPVPRAPCPRAT